MDFANKRVLAVYLADWERGKPYVWGGNDPVGGFDCSGFMVEVLQGAGRLPRKGDWNAAMLASIFLATTTLKPGVLVFYNRGNPPQIGHVVMVYAVIGDTVYTIGAEGGGHGTTTREDAIRQDAYIKVRPILPGWIKAVDPFPELP